LPEAVVHQEVRLVVGVVGQPVLGRVNGLKEQNSQ
jgi:hypothetical protein